MHDVVSSLHDAVGWLSARLEDGLHLALSGAGRVADVWPQGQPAKQLGILVAIAALACVVFLVGRRLLRGIRYAVNMTACVVIVLMRIVPTMAITFLALAGGVWLAKTF